MTEPTRIWKAALLVIGDEILSGRTQDKNVAQVASWLNVQGIRLAEVRVVADDSAAIVEAVLVFEQLGRHLAPGPWSATSAAGIALAGIGFELRKLLQRDSYFALVRAYAYAGLISSGPWVLSIVGLAVIGVMSVNIVVPNLLVTQFQVSVTWLIASSLIVTGVPTGTRSNNSTISALRIRTQPCDPGTPIVAESGLP